MPAAEALPRPPYLYFEKVDENGNYIGGSEWKLTVTERGNEYDKLSDSCYSGMELVVTDNDSEVSREELVVETVGNRFDGTPEEKEYLDVPNFREGCVWALRAEDLDPEPGKIRISNSIFRTDRTYELSEINPPEGFDSGADGPASITFRPRNPYETKDREEGDGIGVALLSSNGTYIEEPGKYSLGDVLTPRGELKHYDPRVDLYNYTDGTELLPSVYYFYPAGKFVNYPVPAPTSSTVTETITETPEPSTITVTPPTTTVTLPSTVTTTVTPPTTTVTETPKTETTTATTTESATTTVTETPQTETVTETPQRETVTHTSEKETETVTETPQKETVTETPKRETVTHTPEKETVTETPKAFTETSTVTASQVTVTETPKQVTETTTLPQKTVTEQVPTTVVENKTETVKLPPVTVTETEKQEPTTVTATPEEVPGEKTTVIETKPGEPTVVSSSPSVEASTLVETTTPSESETSTPAPEERGTASRVLASTGANAIGLMVLSGLVVGVGVFVIRRRK